MSGSDHTSRAGRAGDAKAAAGGFRAGRRSIVRPLAVMLAALALAAGCGVPTDDGVQVLAKEDHTELLEGTTSTTTAPVPSDDDENVLRVGLYFTGPDDKLERIIRPFPEGTTRDQVLEALEEGPFAEEIEAAGFETLQTQLPAGLSASFGVQEGESQTVKVDPEAQLRSILQEQPDRGRLIVTQIVCTALGLDLGEATGIEISDGGEDPIALTDINSVPLQRPANRADFNDCQTGEQERLEAEEAEQTEDA